MNSEVASVGIKDALEAAFTWSVVYLKMWSLECSWYTWILFQFFILLFLNAYFPLSTSQTIGHHSDTACIFLYFLNCTLSFRFHYCYYFEHLIFFTSFNKHYILKVFLCVQLILCSFSLLCDAPWCTCNTIFPISSLNKAITPHWFQLFAIKHDTTVNILVYVRM